jgi:hypothetical protein
MDESFKPFRDMIVELVDQPPIIGDEGYGPRVIMTAIDIETPVELDLTRDAESRLRLGSTPPLYPLLTTVLPSFHRMRVRASLPSDESDG